ncbi:hypothetical protein APTSU1_001833600 [Apodemus speciosus]|uniref:Uncharacterized protein n=1 Tax=Apodemus speciosus TaxID=105296 RepID=A0ABQ0FV44_APOSI
MLVFSTEIVKPYIFTWNPIFRDERGPPMHASPPCDLSSPQREKIHFVLSMYSLEPGQTPSGQSPRGLSLPAPQAEPSTVGLHGYLFFLLG